MAAPIQASSQGATSEGTNPPAKPCPGSPCPPASSCCSLGRTKGERVPRVNKGFVSALSATLSHHKIPLKTRNSSCPLEVLGSNLSHFTEKLKSFDSQHFLGPQANTLYTEESSFFRLGFLTCWKEEKKKKVKKAQCFKLQN